MNTETNAASATDLHHRVWGSGPGVLFIPGASGDSGSFERVADRLAGEFTVVTYDRRGNSRSPALAAGQQMSILDHSQPRPGGAGGKAATAASTSARNAPEGVGRERRTAAFWRSGRVISLLRPGGDPAAG
ncbi:MAG TPA: hypothetical protein VK162_09740 [Streptosporangiaceae bacterium]|nr:hypothetical protein [Streptosporangiaceae bacterium]